MILGAKSPAHASRTTFQICKTLSPRSAMNVVMYTRAGCHLCDDAQRVLEEHGLELAVVDIDAVPALRERFTECVPVVEIDGKIRFRGRVEPVLLRRLMSGRD
jgi:glutaredoxin